MACLTIFIPPPPPRVAGSESYTHTHTHTQEEINALIKLTLIHVMISFYERVSAGTDCLFTGLLQNYPQFSLARIVSSPDYLRIIRNSHSRLCNFYVCMHVHIYVCMVYVPSFLRGPCQTQLYSCWSWYWV